MNRRPCFNMFSHLTSQGLFRMRIPPNNQTQELSLQSFAACGGLIPQVSTLSYALISRNPTMTQTGAHPPTPKAFPEGSMSSCSSPSTELSPGMTEKQPSCSQNLRWRLLCRAEATGRVLARRWDCSDQPCCPGWVRSPHPSKQLPCRGGLSEQTKPSAEN